MITWNVIMLNMMPGNGALAMLVVRKLSYLSRGNK
jgi:hypothetical protein